MPHTVVSIRPVWSEASLLEAAELPAASAVPDWLRDAHDRFAYGLRAARIDTGQGGYAAVWLDAAVEAEEDAAWADDPERAFWLHAVARSLCMAAVRRLVPQAAVSGCAPVPPGSVELAVELRQAGLDCAPGEASEPLRLKRRYAVLTWHPFRGGCGVCALCNACSKTLKKDRTKS